MPDAYTLYTNLDALKLTNPLESKYLAIGIAQPTKIVPVPQIATTGTTSIPLSSPFAGTLTELEYVTPGTLAASNTNFITFTLTNYGQAGAGSTVMLAATAANTTQLTGGSAITAYTAFPLTLTAIAANLIVADADILGFIATVTGTLAGAVLPGILVATFTPTV